MRLTTITIKIRFETVGPLMQVILVLLYSSSICVAERH